MNYTISQYKTLGKIYNLSLKTRNQFLYYHLDFLNSGIFLLKKKKNKDKLKLLIIFDSLGLLTPKQVLIAKSKLLTIFDYLKLLIFKQVLLYKLKSSTIFDCLKFLNFK